MFEVEVKFAVPDPDSFRKRLEEFQIEFGDPVEEVDCFYRHPARDFLHSDECLRIRRRIFSPGVEESFVTYKGPKIDTSTKTRREIEIPLTEAQSWDELLQVLGFTPGGKVRKIRRRKEWNFGSRKFEILLDYLPDLEKRGENAHFVELETLAEEAEVDDARRILLEASATLGLFDSIRTSYLGLLTNSATA